jgi:hypothetical protein
MFATPIPVERIWVLQIYCLRIAAYQVSNHNTYVVKAKPPHYSHIA